MRLDAARAIAVAAGLAVTAGSSAEQPPAPRRVVHMVAERFSFTPSEITVDAGTTVEIRLTSEDTAHGLRLNGPGGIDIVSPKRGRGEAVATFEAREPGEYVFECSRMCGAGHSFMRGRIMVRARATGTPAGGAQ